MVALVTLQQAKSHLRIDYNDEDGDLLDKIQQASEIIIDYVQRSDLVWTDAVNDPAPVKSNAPFRVQAAVLMVLADLWEHRGDEEAERTQADGYLKKPVTAILHRIAKLSYA